MTEEPVPPVRNRPPRVDLTDDEVGSDGDELGRASFARVVADVLERLRATGRSSVVGLVGPWGSGKSSLIRMVLPLMGDEWTVARINPWASQDAAGLTRDFINTIAGALPPDGPASRARRALMVLGGIAAPMLADLPYVGQAVDEARMRRRDRREQADSTIDAQGRRVADALEQAAVPLLVVVDDVDRLHPDELLALFRALRVLGRLPNIQYLVAYDEQTLVDVLTQTPVARDADRALAFIEKIVQVRLDIPPTMPYQAEDMLVRGLGEVLAAAGVTLPRASQERLDRIVGEVLAQVLAEPRSIRRFRALADVYLAFVGPDEVDVVDFLLVTLLRSSFPRVHRAVAAARRSLTDEGPDAEGGGDMALLSRGLEPSELSAARPVLAELFPSAFADDETGMRYRARDATALRLVSSPHYVDRYFALGVPGDDVGDSVLVGWLEPAEREGAFPRVAAEELACEYHDPRRTRRSAMLVDRMAARAAAAPSGRESSLLAAWLRLAEVLPRRAGSGGDPVRSLRAAATASLRRLLAGPSVGAVTPVTGESDLGRAMASTSGLAVLVGAVGQLVRPADGYGESGDALLDEITDRADKAMTDLLANGDRSPEFTRLRRHVVERRGREHVAAVITAGVEEGRWSAMDVAERFVETGYQMGTDQPEEAVGFDADFPAYLTEAMLRQARKEAQPLLKAADVEERPLLREAARWVNDNITVDPLDLLDLPDPPPAVGAHDDEDLRAVLAGRDEPTEVPAGVGARPSGWPDGAATSPTCRLAPTTRPSGSLRPTASLAARRTP